MSRFWAEERLATAGSGDGAGVAAGVGSLGELAGAMVVGAWDGSADGVGFISSTSEAMSPPHDGQNFALSSTTEPQNGQNISVPFYTETVSTQMIIPSIWHHRRGIRDWPRVVRSETAGVTTAHVTGGDMSLGKYPLCHLRVLKDVAVEHRQQEAHVTVCAPVHLLLFTGFESVYYSLLVCHAAGGSVPLGE